MCSVQLSFPLFLILIFRRPPVFYICFYHSPCLIQKAGHYIAVFLPFVIKDFSTSGVLSSLRMPIFLSLSFLYNVSVKLGISCNNTTPYIADFIHITMLFIFIQ